MNWATKYRPKTLDEVVGQDEAISKLKEWTKKPAELPPLLFEGPPGTGKTSAAFALMHDILGEAWESQVLDLNASDERGIDVIREKVKGFARTASLGGGYNYVFLDEADSLTPEAQRAMKRVMEDFAENCKFILCANEPHRIIAPIRDRCAMYHFGPVADDAAVAVIDRILVGEGFVTSGAIGGTDGAAKQIWEQSEGSLRKALNICQQLQPPITADQLALVDSTATFKAIIAETNIREAEKALIRLVKSGVSGGVLFLGLFDAIDASDLPDPKKNKALAALGEYEYRVLSGCRLDIQARCFLRHLAVIR